MVNILSQILLSTDLHLLRLDREIRAEDPAGHFAASPAVAEVAAAGAGEERRVGDGDGDGAAEALAFHSGS